METIYPGNFEPPLVSIHFFVLEFSLGSFVLCIKAVCNKEKKHFIRRFRSTKSAYYKVLKKKPRAHWIGRLLKTKFE